MEDKDWFFLIGSCIFFFYVWGMWYHYKLQRYVEKRCKIPEFQTSPHEVIKEAEHVRKFIMRRARSIMHDADSQHRYAFRDEHSYRVLTYWDGWQYLRSFIWLCYELGIGVEFRTYNFKELTKDEHEERKREREMNDFLEKNPDVFEHIEFKSPASGYPANLTCFLALFLSGGALLSIIAFVFYVMC